MPENVTEIKNEIAKLQKRYDHALLDLKKVKLDAQEERLKYERWVFKMKQKIINFDSILELDKIKHKVTLSRAEYDEICKKRQGLQEEKDRIEKEFQNLKSQS